MAPTITATKPQITSPAKPKETAMKNRIGESGSLEKLANPKTMANKIKGNTNKLSKSTYIFSSGLNHVAADGVTQANPAPSTGRPMKSHGF
jgi:hypothetical protein